MAETLTPAQRSKRVASICGKDTTPEWIVRSISHRFGSLYSLHRADFPGRPDGEKLAHSPSCRSGPTSTPPVLGLCPNLGPVRRRTAASTGRVCLAGSSGLSGGRIAPPPPAPDLLLRPPC
ncbi:MAG: hypothetical protein ACT4PL_06275 [Phycisphaerales bacterium]